MNAVQNTDVPVHTQAQRCALITIVGRPNVGKSTLLNALVGQKISITSRKAQTTRHRITGVHTRGQNQFAFVDTPGLQTRHNNALNKSLHKAALGAMRDVDLIFWVLEAGTFTLTDARVLHTLAANSGDKCPIILVANKIDRMHNKAQLLPWLRAMQGRHDFMEYFPMSAKSPKDVLGLLDLCADYLPQRDWVFDADTLTDKNERFLVSEVIREKLFRLTGDELPYACTVQVDQFEEEASVRFGRFVRLAATILVDRASHKAMVIGEKGDRIKRIGSQARQELESLMRAKLHLDLWVKVKSGWSDDEATLRTYGYE